MSALMRRGITPCAARRWLQSVVLLFVLPSAPLWLLSSRYFVDRPLLSLDAVVAAALCAVSPMLGMVVLALAWLADLVVGFSATYQFTRPADFLAGAAFLNTIQVSQFLTPSLALAALPFVASAALLWVGMRRLPVAWPLVVVLFLAFAGADVVNGSSGLWQRDTRLWLRNIAGSPLHTLGAQWFQGAGQTPVYAIDPRDTAASVVDVEAWARRHPERSVVFVIVESFGLMLDEPSRAWMAARLGAAVDDGRYRLLGGSSAFRGATTSGEMRQLCGLGGHYAMLTEEKAANCLPNRLRRLGWGAVGIHGFAKEMFSRSHWWPLIGLTRVHFGDDPDLISLPRCGAAFRGVCDTAMVQRAFAEARQPQRFVYLLTLNSHLPLQHQSVEPPLLALCTTHGIPPVACQLQAAVASVLDAVAVAARSSPDRPLVVLTGDHAPPFAAIDARSLYDAHRVPVLALLPTDDGSP